MLFVAIAVGLATGCLLGAQPSANGQLGKVVSHPLQAALISFSCGTAILLLLCVFKGIFPPQFSVSPGTLPWWFWTGGAIGAVVVSTSLFFVPRIGSLPWFAAIMTGQTVAAVILDHFGLMGNPQANASPLRIFGAFLLIGGVLMIVEAKRIEHTNRQESADLAINETLLAEKEDRPGKPE